MNLDILWFKDESLEESANLPDADLIVDTVGIWQCDSLPVPRSPRKRPPTVSGVFWPFYLTWEAIVAITRGAVPG